MKTRKIIIFSLISVLILLSFNNCQEELDFTPEDRISTANFPQDEEDIKMLLNGVYSQLRTNTVFWDGLPNFGYLDVATPNAFGWGPTSGAKLGRGDIAPDEGGIVNSYWTKSYSVINKANFLLEQIEEGEVELEEETKSTYVGEAHFLRGFAYSLLATFYGRVPIITSSISAEEARTIEQASVDETWNQAISDYNVAIENLNVEAPEAGRATKGSALGLKMRAYLYQNKFEDVLDVVENIEALNKYSLFPSYEGLFKLENENNQEVIFDVQYMRGENSQGSLHDQYCGTGTGSWTRGTRYVPTENLVEAYEMAPAGEELSTDHPKVPSEGEYQGRDPRLYFTCVLPHTEILDHMFPAYIYEGGAYNHPGNRFKRFSGRKFFIEDMDKLPPAGQSDLNYIVLRYADVILSKAEAIIETGGDVDEAIDLINKIRRDREDVTLKELPQGMSREEAREALRYERRIEFALEGRYWQDIKRWHELDGYADEIYPVEVRDRRGNLLETKFPNGYQENYKYLPIPDSELSLNENLEQNPGW